MESGNPPSFRKLWEAIREVHRTALEQRIVETPNLRISRTARGQVVEVQPQSKKQQALPDGQVRQCYITGINDNKLTCRTYVLKSSLGQYDVDGDAFFVWMPFLLRKDKWDGKTSTALSPGITYQWTGIQERTARVGSAYTELQVITPLYKAGDIIYAAAFTDSDAVNAVTQFVDINADGRAWARKAYQ